MSKSSIKLDKGPIINVQVVLFQEDEIWVAYCPALELSSYGDDEVDAKKAFNGAMKIFISETQRKGTLEKYLLKKGWQLRQKPKPVYDQPVFTLQESKRFLNKNPHIYNERVALPAM